MKCNIKYIISFFVFNVINLLISTLANKNSTNDSILIVRLDAIGDYILFRNFIQNLHDFGGYKDKRFVLVGNLAWKDIALELDSGVIDEFIWIDRKKFSRNLIYRYQMLELIASISYEIVISPVFSREFFYSDWIVKSVSAKEKVGSVGDLSNITVQQKAISDKWFTKLLPAKNELMFEFDRNREFFENLLNRKLDITKPHIYLKPKSLDFNIPENYAVLFVGASSPFRKWPIDRFADVAQFLKNNYGLEIVLCGGPGDLDDAALFGQSFSGEFLNLVGKTTLVDLLYVISNENLMVSNETSAPHFAVALKKTNIFVLYNGNHYGRFTPYSQAVTDGYHVIFHPEIEKNLDNYKLLSNNYGYGSDLDIRDITVGMVASKIERVFGVV